MRDQNRRPLLCAAFLVLCSVAPLATQAQMFNASINRSITEGNSGALDNNEPSDTDPTGHTFLTDQTSEQSLDFGEFMKELPREGEVTLASFKSNPSQDTTVTVTATNLIASGVLEVRASGTSKLLDGVGVLPFGTVNTADYSYFALGIGVNQPMGAVLQITTDNQATDTSTLYPVVPLYHNTASISVGPSQPFGGDSQVLYYGDAYVNAFNEPFVDFHNSFPSSKIAFRVSTSFSLELNVNSFRNGNGPENTVFSYDRKLNFNFVLQPLVDLPEFISFDVTAPNPARSTSTWQFAAKYSSSLDGLNVQVEFSPTGEDGTWSALPGGSTMTPNNGAFTLTSHSIPKSTVFFRAVANSPLANAPVVSKPAKGPYNVLPGFEPAFGEFVVLPWEVNALSGIYAPGTYTFTIPGPTPFPGLRVHVQYQFTDPGASTHEWLDLTGGGTMKGLGSPVLYDLESNELPLGLPVIYRVVASATGYEDMYSDTAGPYTETTDSPVGFHTGVNVSLSDVLTKSANALISPANCANVTVNASPAPATAADALVLSAPNCGQVALSVPPNTTVNAGAVVAADNATIVNQGSIKGNLTLAPTAKIVAQGGGNIVAQGGGNIVAQGGGNIVAQGGGNIVAQGGGNLISPNGSNLAQTPGGSLAYNPSTPGIVAQGGGNIVSHDGGSIVAQGGGNLGPGKTRLHIASLADAPPPPSFTGVMNVDGDFTQYAGTLYIAIAGTDTSTQGAQQYDQLWVTGRANLLGGSIAFGLIDPNSQTNAANAFQPTVGSTFDVVVAKSIKLWPQFGVRGQVFADGRFFQWNVVDRADGMQALRLTVANIPPLLGLLVSSNNVQVGYAINYSGYAIQSSKTLSPTDWVTLTTETNVVTLPATSGPVFFRLLKP